MPTVVLHALQLSPAVLQVLQLAAAILWVLQLPPTVIHVLKLALPSYYSKHRTICHTIRAGVYDVTLYMS